MCGLAAAGNSSQSAAQSSTIRNTGRRSIGGSTNESGNPLARACANISCRGIRHCSGCKSLRCKSGQRPEAGRQHHRRPRTRYSRFRSAEGRRVRYLGADRGGGDFRYADHSRRQGRSRSRSSRCPGAHSDDYKTWTFKLRPGVKFHDGTPFNAEAVKANFDRQKDPANKCRCAFYIADIKDVQAPDELTVVYNLNDPSVNLPALMTIPELEQCHPVADGVEDQGRRLQSQSGRHRSLYLEVLDRGRPHGAGKESGLLEQGASLSRSHRAEAAAGCAVALRQPAIGRGRYHLGRRIRRRQYPEGAEGLQADGAHLCRLRRPGLRLQHQGRAVRRRPRAPGAGDGDRSQEDVAGDHQRSRPAGQQSLSATVRGSSARTTARCPTMSRKPRR